MEARNYLILESEEPIIKTEEDLDKFWKMLITTAIQHPYTLPIYRLDYGAER